MQQSAMTYTSSKQLSFEAFITQFGDNTRYELIDGELREMEPTGPHEAVAGNIAGRIYLEIFRANLNWLVPKNCLIKPLYAEATALRPDEEKQINIWFSVPSLLIQLILRGNLQQHQFPELRKILFAGEVFPIQYLRQLIQMIPYVQYCNIYGSAETGARTYYLFKDLSPDMISVPIGKACDNTELFVVNEQNEIASEGTV